MSEPGAQGRAPAPRWLELLMADATGEEFGRHRDLLSSAAPTAQQRALVERDFGTASRLHGRLAEQRRRAMELAALNDISTKLTTMRDQARLLEEVVGQAKGLLDVDLAYLGLVADDQFVIEVSRGVLTQNLVGLEVPHAEGLVGIVLRGGAPLWTSDYDADQRFAHVARIDTVTQAERIRGLLGVPLRAREKVIGALLVATRHEHAFSDADVSLLSALAAHAAVAIDNARSLRRLNHANAELSRRTVQLEKTARWDRTLTHVVLNGGGVEQLVREVATLVECPVYFLSERNGLPVDLRAYADSVHAMFDSARPGSEIDGVEVEDGHSRLVGQAVAAGGVVLGLVVAVARCPVAEDLSLVLERAAPALALSLAAARAARLATRRARDGFLIDLLTRPAGTEVAQRDQFRLADLDPESDYVVLAGEPIDGTADTIAALRGAALTSPAIAEHGPRVVGVVPSSDAASVAAAVSAAKTRATVGISGPCRGAAGLARAYEEAQQTVRVLGTIDRVGDTETADGLGIYRILLTHLGRRQIESMIAGELGILAVDERRHGVPLIDTLSVYLAHGRQLTGTAAELGVHVNTVRQRLETVDRLIGPEWRGPDRALDLQVILRLRRGAILLDGASATSPGL